METEKKEPVEKRKKYMLAQVVDVFIGRQSRKVAFGVWGFLAANSLIASGKIDMIVYWKMFLTCALLIGFGTILDSIVEKIGDQLAGKIATRIKPEVADANPINPAITG